MGTHEFKSIHIDQEIKSKGKFAIGGSHICGYIGDGEIKGVQYQHN